MQSHLSDILSFLQAALLLGALIVSVRQLRLLGQQIKLMAGEIHEQVDWQRKNATFEYLNLYMTQFKDINEQLGNMNLLKHDGQSIGLGAMNKELKDDSNRANIFHLVAYFENLSIGISQGYFDESITISLLYNVVTSTYDSLIPYLMIRRSETGVEVGSNFEKLAQNWRAYKKMPLQTPLHGINSGKASDNTIGG